MGQGLALFFKTQKSIAAQAGLPSPRQARGKLLLYLSMQFRNQDMKTFNTK